MKKKRKISPRKLKSRIPKSHLTRSLLIAAALVLVGSIGLSLIPFFTHSTGATSDYGVRLTNYLHLGGTDTAGDCPVTDMTSTWTDLMSTDTSVKNSYKNSWSYTSNFGGARAALDSFQSDYANAVASGSGWGVSQTAHEGHVPADPDFLNANDAITIWVINPASNLSVSQAPGGYGQLSTDVAFETATAFLNPNAGCRLQFDNSNGAYVNYPNYLSFNNDEILVFNTKNAITYPSDYSGNPISNGVAPPTVSQDELTLLSGGVVMIKDHSIPMVQKNHDVTISDPVVDNGSGVAGGEYYIDTDPGQGNGVPLSYTNGKITGSLAVDELVHGYHTLYVRAKGKSGNWSNTVSVTFKYP